MMESEIIKIVLTAAVTGFFSTGLTVVALKVHIDYLRENVKRVDNTASRAHKRIDELVRG